MNSLRTTALSLARRQPSPANLPSRLLSTTPRTLASFDATLASSSSSSAPSSAPTSSRPPLNAATTTTSTTSSFIPPHATRLPPPPSLTPDVDTALLSTLARLIMKSGKLARAHSHLALCLDSLALSTSSPPLPILHRALEVASPSIRIVGRRKGTKSLPTPQPLTQSQRTRQAWKWIVEASDKRQGSEKVFGKRLAAEVLAVLGGQSEAIKKKEAKHVQGVTGRANVGR